MDRSRCSRWADFRSREPAALVVEAKLRDACSNEPPKTIALASYPLRATDACPAGEVAIDGASVERVLLPMLAATLDPKVIQALSLELGAFSNQHGLVSSKAFVVGCAEPTWLLFGNTATGDGAYRPYQAAPPTPPPVLTAPSSEPLEPEPPEPGPLVTGVCHESLEVGETVWIGRVVSTGFLPGPSSLGTWTLGTTKGVAKLVQREFVAARSGAPSNEQPQGTMRCARSIAWEGSVTGSAPMHFKLSQGAGGQHFELLCTSESVPVARASARRIRIPSREEGCNASRWSDAMRQPTPLLVCREPTHPDSPVYLARAPGVERVVFDEDDCDSGLDALRSIPRDGAVATAVRLDEQPVQSVPAHLRPAEKKP
jgi:hypothetical protein